jgi:hypothetical protein
MKPSSLFRAGDLVECVQNTYRPDLDGTTRMITYAGPGAIDYIDHEGNPGHTSGIVLRDNHDGTYTFRLKTRPSHRVTLRPITKARTP